MGAPEVVVIVLVFLVIWRIPSVINGLGNGVRVWRKGKDNAKG